jgi:carbonic anhydrase
LHRNVGNLAVSIDFNIQSIIQHAVEILKIKHIIVIGHSECDAINSAVTCKYHGLIDHWWSYIRDVAEKNYDELELVGEIDPELLNIKLVELNIKEQVLNICKNPIIQKAWHNGQEISVHGCLYETETGILKDLDIMEHQWREIEHVYNLTFPDTLLNN